MAAPLAVRAHGRSGAPGHPLVLLHGLTFDHQMWAPVIAALPAGRQALAVDLPGHGGSPALASHDPESVAAAVHATVVSAGIERPPVVVGHSLGALVALVYALAHPVAGVVDVDAPVEPAAAIHRLGPQLRGGGFHRIWARFEESMGKELLPAGMRELLAAGDTVAPELVLSYWAPLLDQPPDQNDARSEALAAYVREAGVPLLAIFAATRERAQAEWIEQRVPSARVEVWPARHHFPHLADPGRFAATVAAFAAAPEPARR